MAFLSRFFRKQPPALNALAEVKSNNAPSGMSQYALYRGLGGYTYAFLNLHPHEIVRHYTRVAPLHLAVKKLGNAVGSLPYILYDPQTDEKITTHPLLDLLRQPNPFTDKTKRDFFRNMAIWKVLEGDTYIMATGSPSRPPLELYTLNALYVDPEPDKLGHIGSYVYRTPWQTQTFFRVGSSARFLSENGMQELWHIANFNPEYGNSDTLDGMSEIEPLYYEINQYLHACQHNLSLLQNGARPSGAFVLKTQDGQPAVLSDEAFMRLKGQIDSEYTGAINSGRPIVLEGGLEFVEMSLSPKDLDFKELKDSAEEAIYKCVGVPVQLVMSQKVTSNNMSNIRLEFYENTVLPFGDDLCDHLTAFLLPRYRDLAGKRLIIDRDEIDVLAESRAKRREIIEKSLIMTVNEKRKLFKLDDIAGGNKIVDPNGRPIAGEDVPEITQAPPEPPQPTEK